MTEHLLPGRIDQAFSHMFVLGLATIAEQEGLTAIKVHWTEEMNPSPVLNADQSWEEVCVAVRNHAARLSHDGSWIWRETGIQGKRRALFSPRAGMPANDEWPGLAAQRHGQVAAMSVAPTDRASLRLIGALGTPAYWGRVRQREIQVDDGASRWEMKTRNAGEEFVGKRLRPLCAAVAARDPDQISDALLGRTLLDEKGKPAPADSRLATGLRSPQSTDAVAAWCALWGIACFPVAHHLKAASGTAGYVEEYPHGRFVIPVPCKPFTLASIRVVCSSRHPTEVVKPRREAADAETSKSWLLDRGVVAVVSFPLHVTLGKAPEMWADPGTVISTRPTGARE